MPSSMNVPKNVWLPLPIDLTLSRDEVHVWRTHLDLPVSRIRSLQGTLAADELSRAARFHFPRDREHFIVARGLLRAILSLYLRTEPSQLRFHYGSYGKPALDTVSGQDTLSFNLSHSGGLVLYAITLGRKIGIDLERIREDFEFEQLAERFFSPLENTALRTLTSKLKQKAFFSYWTRKEAYLKARGEGLSIPSDRFDIPLAADEPSALLQIRGDPQEVSGWILQDLNPGPEYVAAVAVEGCDWRLNCWDYQA